MKLFFLVVRVIAALLAKKKQEVCPKEVLNAAVETTESSRRKTTTKLLFPSSLFLRSESESFFFILLLCGWNHFALKEVFVLSKSDLKNAIWAFLVFSTERRLLLTKSCAFSFSRSKRIPNTPLFFCYLFFWRPLSDCFGFGGRKATWCAAL